MGVVQLVLAPGVRVVLGGSDTLGGSGGAGSLGISCGGGYRISGFLSELNALLNERNKAKLKALQRRTRSSTDRLVQKYTRGRKSQWWEEKAESLQQGADKNNMKAFYNGLREVYGPQNRESTNCWNKMVKRLDDKPSFDELLDAIDATKENKALGEWGVPVEM
ncbi:hypothetical protein EB796_014920 [Bugula neritina]|uniref:Uncharacterized protein n=1 Tax=Bugula neritina TaxID=10212 RepID=A0A7J7JK92_BUGNE|nr:hypothetical protein EB796_014920 [Bugula neritina]